MSVLDDAGVSCLSFVYRRRMWRANSALFGRMLARKRTSGSVLTCMQELDGVDVP